MCMSDRMAMRLAARPDPEGLDTLVERLTPRSPCLIVIEASGGYESVVAASPAHAGLAVAILDPGQVGKLAGAIGRLANTDAINAAVIAHFAQAGAPGGTALARRPLDPAGRIDGGPAPARRHDQCRT